MVRVAAVQMDVHLGDPSRNMEKIIGYAENTEADLVVFPECANSGYAFDSRSEALTYAQTVPGPLTGGLAAAARKKKRCFAAGLLETQDAELFNTAVFVTPDGKIQTYRKTHIPFLGVDRFVARGNELPVFDSPFGRIGLIICYEWRFPETARSLSLRGADLLIGLSNWPVGAEIIPELLVPARAAENRVWVLSANRAGTERGIHYIGRSTAIDPGGNTVAELKDDEGILTAVIDPAQSRTKRIVKKPGEYEIGLFEDRRPELYTGIFTEVEDA
ncbi:MAG: carbon-nitrogen hydrolase family protein [Desulfobacterales bacterium]